MGTVEWPISLLMMWYKSLIHQFQGGGGGGTEDSCTMVITAWPISMLVTWCINHLHNMLGYLYKMCSGR